MYAITKDAVRSRKIDNLFKSIKTLNLTILSFAQFLNNFRQILNITDSILN
ncbi:hypothetical protein [Calothrix sp. NIES-3974]|uniref:hypothetical protein n=1 Tax=Calothrix sp. NIES-3974 TaxID=2005462 RepID=UPI0012FDFBAF|nr:hypothetical protein [Calothrix sp. NIES-3974]